MPIYEYECTQCGAVEEVMQRFSDKPLKKCPKCSGRLRKLVSQSAFHLKGSGWYVTDYARKPKKDTSATESKSASPDTGSGKTPPSSSGSSTE